MADAEDGDERRSRRARSTRDRRGRTTERRSQTRRSRTDPPEEPSRRAEQERGRATPDASRARRRRPSDDAAPKTTGRASTTRRTDTRTRRRTEPARPDSSGTSRARGTGRDAGRPSTRRLRPDAVRVLRGEPGRRPAPTRARYLRRRWVAVLVAASVLVLTYAVLFTSLLGVRSVEVVGVREIPKDDVIRAADIADGTPMVRLDADEAAARVAKLPRVFEVRVERSWPSTVQIIVTERAPVAVLRAGSEIHLVDETGLDYATAATAPPNLPTLAMANVKPENPATRSAVSVLGAIPRQLRVQVTTVTAETPGDVRLTLTDGRVVKWGNADENARKAAVLGALLTRPGRTYDVATPDFPTVSG
ncbi:cell division protein FtsQ/DivIB [Actinophytocola oryzae]|uniref:Cell division protein FtsQ n=1 Tax=Actinophytocola oryzae TaxID=502181 RepID=A0A4R7VB91_9PSEU|nr:FtsQ-type POTRA domain-containing protein [Actinophytocola oryzae]TDV46303.1 cell division protein FtsQ [Actinophytocola oryzae]